MFSKMFSIRCGSPALIACAIAAAGVSGGAGLTQADTITNLAVSSTIPTNSDTSGIDITNGGTAIDWRMYGPGQTNGAVHYDPSQDVYDSAVSTESISALGYTDTNSSQVIKPASNPQIYITYSGGTNSAAASNLHGTSYSVEYDSNSSGDDGADNEGLTFTQTLLAASEHFTVYQHYNPGSTTVLSTTPTGTIAVALGSASDSISPDIGDLYNVPTTTSYLYITTFDVTGSVGDTLTFTDEVPVDTTGNSIGIYGVSVASSVPVPATLYIVAAGAAGLLLLKRRRKSA